MTQISDQHLRETLDGFVALDEAYRRAKRIYETHRSAFFACGEQLKAAETLAVEAVRNAGGTITYNGMVITAEGGKLHMAPIVRDLRIEQEPLALTPEQPNG